MLQLAEAFAFSMCRELDWPVFPGFSEQACQKLLAYRWPGNIRELKNVIERSLYRHADPELPLEAILFDPFRQPWAETETTDSEKVAVREDIRLVDMSMGIKQKVAEFESGLIKDALRQHGFQQKRTAEYLGITYHQLRAYLRKYPQLNQR